MSEAICIDMNVNHLEEVLEIERLSFTTPWSRDAFISELTKNQTARYRIVVMDNRVVAYGGMWILFDEAHITNIAVHPEYRGKGLGNLLVRDMIECARRAHIESMTLEVRRSNIAAISLYRKWGFKETAIRKGYYQDTKEDAIIMWKHNVQGRYV